MTHRKFLPLALVLLLAGCASAVVKVEGEQTLNNKLSVQLPDAWNRLHQGNQPYERWTQEGASIDQLRIWAGVPAGKELMVPPPTPSGQKAPRVPTFTGNMALDELAGLFEMLYAADGSHVKMTRVEPAAFAGASGVRFEFMVTVKTTDLQMRGMGWAVVRNNELYAATYTAPDLAFFKRLAPKAQAVVTMARFAGEGGPPAPGMVRASLGKVEAAQAAPAVAVSAKDAAAPATKPAAPPSAPAAADAAPAARSAAVTSPTVSTAPIAPALVPAPAPAPAARPMETAAAAPARRTDPLTPPATTQGPGAPASEADGNWVGTYRCGYYLGNGVASNPGRWEVPVSMSVRDGQVTMTRGDGSYEETLRGALQAGATTVLEGEGQAPAAAPSAWKTKATGSFVRTADALRFEGQAQLADHAGRAIRHCRLELARQR